MRIAVSIWGEKISPVLDTATRLLIIEHDIDSNISRFETRLPEQNISRRCSFIRDLDIDVLICGAVSRQMSGLLTSAGIKVISEISGPAEAVIDAYFQGTLLQKEFFMPGRRSNHTAQNQSSKIVSRS
jgi:predicted Fe-Mo cluster-binding NifX family protein